MNHRGKHAKEFYLEVIERTEQVRKYLRIGKSAFAREIGLSAQTYNNFIGSQKSKPSIDLLLGVVNRYRVSPLWLLTGRGPMIMPEDLVGELALEFGGNPPSKHGPLVETEQTNERLLLDDVNDTRGKLEKHLLHAHSLAIVTGDLNGEIGSDDPKEEPGTQS